jgi:hypothetical protein
MSSRYSRLAFGAFAVFVVGGIVDHFAGPNAYFYATLAIVLGFAAFQSFLKLRARWQIGKIAKDDERPVRVECRDDLASQFTSIASDLGWQAENPQAISDKEVSIRFFPSATAQSVKDLLGAFNKAGLVQNIRP